MLSEQSDSPTTGSGQWKREHPDRAREMNQRYNAARPDRDRSDIEPCARCGKPKAARKKTGLCRACWLEDRRSPASHGEDGNGA